MDLKYLPRRGNRVQAWQDKQGVMHVVFFSSPPHKVVCKKSGLWGYTPRLAAVDDITCSECENEIQELKNADSN